MLFSALLLTVHVTIDMAAPIDRATMARVAAEVTAIWKPYADVAFVDGSDSRGSGADEEIRLVVVDRPGSDRRSNDVDLGWIDFHGTEPASTIAVSAMAARRLADTARLAGRRLSELPRRVRDEFVAHALSRGIAHEIGHYLLRSPAHTERGLMRARFWVDEFLERGLARYR